ncbi:MAG TPA: hydantoinase B/oxoprolinase family protein [Candidatus Binatia bacterium]|nr:hydantoinase B/oxoprolinase family protein [Candidatus Binatia bacterium]
MIDPITLEVIRETLVSTVREMRVTLVRTAYSSILYEGEDFSCVLMDGDASIVAMSKGQDHPLHIVPIGWSMKAVRDRFGDDIHPGDMFLHNDPYTGGTHLNDVALIMPLFAAGRLFIFPVVRAHWGDVGGMSAGSLSGGATEIFQEGVRIPPIRIIDQGRPNEAALELIFANMRGPRERRGDYHAMIGTCRKAAERVEGLAAKYGAGTVRAAVAELMNRAEGRMRRAIAALPDGEYVYEAHLESGRERLEPLTVRARVAVAGETITVDLAGTSPQTAGPTNVGPAMAPTGAFTIIKSFLDPGSDVNSGAFRPLTVLTPRGTIVNADPPAPCGGMVEVKYCVETAVMGALAQALDGRVAGDLKGGGNHCYVGGPDPQHPGETFIFYEYPAGGTGGFEGGDGSNTVRTWTESDMTTLQPIEAIEQRYPVRVEATSLREDSGGPGRWRGGLGLTRAVRILAAHTRLSVLAERAVLPPFGVCGGGSGATNRFYLRRDGHEVAPSPLPGKVGAFPIERDDVVMMESSGGGGFGDALARDPARVAADVAEGYVTPAAAEAVYGVVLRDGAPDAERTRAARDALRGRRRLVRVEAAPGLDDPRGRAVRLDSATAAALGAGAGAVVELVNPRGAPLRAWVVGLLPGEPRRAEIAPAALRMLALRDGAEAEVRAVHSGALGR